MNRITDNVFCVKPQFSSWGRWNESGAGCRYRLIRTWTAENCHTFVTHFNKPTEEEVPVALRKQVTPEQFKTIFNGPVAAAQYVATASGGALELVREMFASANAMREQAIENASAYGPLVESIAEDMKEFSLSDAGDLSVRVEGRDIETVRAGSKQLVADAAAAVAAMPGADGYKRWVLDVARAAAAAKTGGFLGFGAKSVVDEQEEAALAELEALLAAPSA